MDCPKQNDKFLNPITSEEPFFTLVELNCTILKKIPHTGDKASLDRCG